MPDVETIQVHWPDKGKGIFRINAADFDPKVHKHLTDKEAAKAAASDNDSGDSKEAK